MSEQKSGFSWKWPVIVVTGLAVIGIGVWFFTRGDGDVPQFQTTTVGRGDLTQEVTATGTLNPVVNVTVGSQVSGIISKLNVDYNSIVKSNEVIAEIDPSTYQAQVNQAKADLANARANLELQQVEAERDEELFTNKLLSGSDYDTAIATRDEAAAMVEIKKAALTNSMVNLNYCKILSPVDGIVILRAVDVGQTVASSFNTPTLFQIANDLTKMQIDTSVAEADVGGVTEGQSVDFTVDAYPYRTFQGTVTQVRNSPTTVNNVVTYDCVIGVTNADYKLKPGMTANVNIIIAQRKNVLTIPNGALRFRPPDNVAIETNSTTATEIQSSQPTSAVAPPAARGQGRRGGNGGNARNRGERQMFHTVFVLSGEGDNARLVATEIKTGISDGLSTEVVSGLNEGDRLVISVSSSDAPVGAAAANPFGGGGGRRF